MTDLAERLIGPIRLQTSTAIVVALVGAGAAIYLRALEFRGEALPGTRVAGVELSGLDRQATVLAVKEAVATRLARPVRIRVGKRSVSVEPRELFALNAVATAD